MTLVVLTAKDLRDVQDALEFATSFNSFAGQKELAATLRLADQLCAYIPDDEEAA